MTTNELTRPGCPTPVDVQLESLRAIEPGWFDESSPAYEPTSLMWLSKVLTALIDAFQLPRPFIYPTPEGWVRAEWSGAVWELIVTFDLHRHSADVLAVRLDSDEQNERAISLGEAGSETELGCFLAKHLASRRVDWHGGHC